MRQLEPGILYKGHQDTLDKLERIRPDTQFVAIWILRHETEVNAREAQASLVPVAVPAVDPEKASGYFLMRVYVDSETTKKSSQTGLVTVDMPSVTSRPFSTVWSDTRHAREVRKQLKDSPICWSKDHD